MSYREFLQIASHWAAILTAVVAAWAYGVYRWDRQQKRLRLEDYLRDEKARGGDEGQRTVLHLVAQLGMSESEIVDASFRSNCIHRKVRPDQHGLADTFLLEYVEPSDID